MTPFRIVTDSILETDTRVTQAVRRWEGAFGYAGDELLEWIIPFGSI